MLERLSNVKTNITTKITSEVITASDSGYKTAGDSDNAVGTANKARVGRKSCA